MSINPIPDGYRSVNVSLTIKGAAEALEFYKKAFDAVELYRLTGKDGTIAHAEFKIGNTVLMLSDEAPEWGALSAETIGGCPVSLLIYVPDADAAFAQAVAAGANEKMAPSDQFWGDRMSSVADPYGYKWNLATHIEDVSPEEIQSRYAAWAKENG